MPDGTPAALEPALRRLAESGWVERDGEAVRPTRRWRAAMMRAAARLVGTDAPEDLRVPVAVAMIEAFPDEDVTPLVIAMTWVIGRA
jgi:hypothetical protein